VTAPPRFLVQLRAVLVKEIRQTLQDRRVLFLLTIAPFLQLLMFGYAIDLDVDRVPTVIVDQDDTSTSRELTRRLLADGTLLDVGHVDSVAEADRVLERGDAAVALVFPPGFGRDLLRGTGASVQVMLDGTDPNRSGVAGGAAARFFGDRALELSRARLQAAGVRAVPQVTVRPRLLFNPRLSTAVFMVPGIAGMLLLIITTIVTSMGLAREKEMGTLEQVRVTPIPSTVLMVGKVLPFVVIGLFDVTLAITAGAWLFGLPIHGSLLVFYFLTTLYLLSTVGMGLFISTMAGTQQQAYLGGFMFVMPAMQLSGTITPIHAMPRWLQPVTYVNPLRFYMEGNRAILLKNAGVADLKWQILALTIYGLGIVALASLRFRKRAA
jgi:ABC-2 type transport system permease protein